NDFCRFLPSTQNYLYFNHRALPDSVFTSPLWVNTFGNENSNFVQFFANFQQQMIVEPILRYPRLAGGVPGAFSGFGIQVDIIRKWRSKQLTWHQQTRFAEPLVPALARRVRKCMIMAGNKIIGPIGRQKFRSFRFFTATASRLSWAERDEERSTVSRFVCES